VLSSGQSVHPEKQSLLTIIPEDFAMNTTFKSLFAAGLFTLSSSMTFAAGPAATIDQLQWMTGNYAGALGPNTLEENWIAAEAGSIAAMVRMTGPTGTLTIRWFCTCNSLILVLNPEHQNP
jgi:hypothetical protein